MTPPSSLAYYVLLYSVCLFFVRFQAAIITMPMAVDCGIKSSNDKSVLMSHYAALNDYYLLSIVAINMVLIVIITWLDRIDILYVVFSVSIATVVVALNEFVRRVLLLSEEYKLLIYFDVSTLMFLSLGVYGVVYLGGEGAQVLAGFALPGFSSWVLYVFLRKNITNYLKPRLTAQVKNNISLIIASLSQWFSGQSAYYISAVFLTPIDVSILAILRNLFGPMNVLLLSLEGILPQRMSESYKIYGYLGLKRHVLREMVILGSSVVLFSFIIYLYGSSLVVLIYGEDKWAMFYRGYLVGMACIYGAAVLSRVVMVALRSAGSIQSIGKISIIGAITFLIISLLLISTVTPTVGMVIIGMITSEVVILTLLLKSFSHIKVTLNKSRTMR